MVAPDHYHGLSQITPAHLPVQNLRFYLHVVRTHHAIVHRHHRASRRTLVHQISSETFPGPTPCHNDIGALLMPDKSISQSCRAVGGLSGAEKYHLLYHHVQPPKVLPSTYSHGCNRKFTVAWLEKYPWLRYSPSQDGVYCGPCAVMLSEDSRRGKQSLVNKPFSNWVKISRVLGSHSKLVYHRDAAQAADILKS